MIITKIIGIYILNCLIPGQFFYVQIFEAFIFSKSRTNFPETLSNSLPNRS